MRIYNSTFSGGIISQDAGKTELSKDSFLKIMAAQLQNQDPMNAQDNTQYVAQMAQFTALEQMNNLNDAMENLNNSMAQLLLSQRFEEANLMVGRIAKVALEDDQYVTGEVTGAKLSGSSINIIIDGKEYNADNVVELTSKESV